MSDNLTCPTCWATDLDEDELCQHHYPICLPCCMGGEHDWMPREAA